MQSSEQQHGDQQPDNSISVADRMRAEHARLDTLLAGIGDERFVRPGTFGAWSVKDMLAHITFWEQRLIAYVNGAQESLVRPGEDEQVAIDRINAEVLAANRDRPLAEVRAAFADSYQRVLALAESLSTEDLADQEFSGLLAGDTFEHYREHIGMLESWQAAQGQS